MDTLRERLQLVMEGYAGRALNGYSYLMSSADRQVFAIVSVGHVRDRRIVDTGLVARLVGDRITIERDVNHKPLVDALVEAGVRVVKSSWPTRVSPRTKRRRGHSS